MKALLAQARLIPSMRQIHRRSKILNGMVLPPDLPGLGLQPKEGLFERKDIVVETIAGK